MQRFVSPFPRAGIHSRTELYEPMGCFTHAEQADGELGGDPELHAERADPRGGTQTGVDIL